MIEAQEITVRHGHRLILDRVCAVVRPGRLLAILGPNGAGKSTLLGMLAGETAPSGGTVLIGGRPADGWSTRELARYRAVMPQAAGADAEFLTEEVVALGRLPFARTTAALDDAQAVAEAIAAAGAGPLAGRRYGALSGGERQRVQWARVLAQLWSRDAGHGRAVLLDEPTSAMDLRHQGALLAEARRLARRGVAVAAVLHDLNLAAAHADDVLLLSGGRLVASGPAEDLLAPEPLSACYGVPVERLCRADGRPVFATG
ncbi:heme ABC transporter ATP-binding protein [Azospirillum thermophilum]|uniref:Heme ABC transporter ATP-binding protein n=1 Tax=Azospirillum thermophilum TaxID=2202148 RepID=A0A2S2CLK7_9PROT|nr:heme ABC transporter ATP-binding protein [Azospirillum thermophilum]AWK85395.1 heme ABC transporter ATP-binding protein [Azospirillum thermophilum]